ncbi:MAG TPA: polyprenyl synthetase family protein [Thermoanaerobaculia bacterium]|nr:polyprenyl synthetase family protein [Thermoanaerobaculia bacterium]
MTFEAIKAAARRLHEFSEWPEILDLIERVGHREGISVWDHPFASCQAVGGTEAAALPGAAAVFCSLLSIHLVDDMLDDEPCGQFRRLGAGPAANLALALQAGGHRLLSDPSLEPGVSAAAQRILARMALGTAYGQGLDIREARSEEEYWRIVEAKTPPLFGAAFEIGALLGGAPAEVCERLERIGRLLGRFIQVSDDLSDALQTPAKVDWNRPSNNLAILYALTAHHPARGRFRELAARSGDPEALSEAHQVLLKSGAVSYCTFKMIEFSQEAQEILNRTPLPDPEPVARVLRLNLRPLHRLLENVGVEEPELITV